MSYINFTTALVNELGNLLDDGKFVDIVGRTGVKSSTLELTGRLITIDKPTERVICIPHRNNNIFATVAETVWVLAGRNDVNFLSRYLPRAVNFSDDGVVWRAGYGPRLRNYDGVDQIMNVVNILKSNLTSRQAVISIFDPRKDYEDSKDIPCTNWIHFMVRDGKLLMSIVMRSNDIIWGASGINWFEWSVLHEYVAQAVGVDVGKMTYFADSLHLYSDHYGKAEKIVKTYTSNMYTAFGFESDKLVVGADMDEILSEILEIEDMISVNAYARGGMTIFSDPDAGLLGRFRDMLILWNFIKIDDTYGITHVLNSMYRENGNLDLRVAAIEYITRTKELPSGVPVHPNEIAFLSQFSATNKVTNLL
jgi:thymidylate synthase